MLYGFPISARYLLIRLIPCLSWLVAIPGLIRRMLIGFVKVEGVIKLKTGDKKQYWLVLKNLLHQSINIRYSLSAEVGIQGFLDYLKREEVKYVVLRFYDKLPILGRPGGDLDILVTD